MPVLRFLLDSARGGGADGGLRRCDGARSPCTGGGLPRRYGGYGLLRRRNTDLSADRDALRASRDGSVLLQCGGGCRDYNRMQPGNGHARGSCQVAGRRLQPPEYGPAKRAGGRIARARAASQLCGFRGNLPRGTGGGLCKYQRRCDVRNPEPDCGILCRHVGKALRPAPRPCVRLCADRGGRHAVRSARRGGTESARRGSGARNVPRHGGVFGQAGLGAIRNQQFCARGV